MYAEVWVSDVASTSLHISGGCICYEGSNYIPHTHPVTQDMKLLPAAGSDKAWVYTVQADFADEEAKVEQLAIRFKNAESKRNMLSQSLLHK